MSTMIEKHAKAARRLAEISVEIADHDAALAEAKLAHKTAVTDLEAERAKLEHAVLTGQGDLFTD